jgi:hypothetical protein
MNGFSFRVYFIFSVTSRHLLSHIYSSEYNIVAGNVTEKMEKNKVLERYLLSVCGLFSGKYLSEYIQHINKTIIFTRNLKQNEKERTIKYPGYLSFHTADNFVWKRQSFGIRRLCRSQLYIIHRTSQNEDRYSRYRR